MNEASEFEQFFAQSCVDDQNIMIMSALCVIMGVEKSDAFKEAWLHNMKQKRGMV